MPRPSGPAYRIETERTSLRCLEPRHAAMVSAAIEQSLEHLRPWMSWAVHEPMSFEKRVERMRTNRGHFDLGSDYIWGIFSKDASELYGVIALKQSSDVDERELGYWLHVSQVGKGLAYEAGLAAVRVGFDIEALDSLEIRTAPDNTRSAAIAQRLGFAGPLLDPLSYAAPDGGKRDTHLYSLSRVQYVLSPARRCVLQAFDVLDRPLI